MASQEPPAQQAPRLAHRVLRSVELNLAGQLASMAVALWLTPVVLRGLGTEGYALYTLIGTGLGYLLLLTFGAPVATVRFTAFHHGRAEPARLAEVIRLSLLVHLIAAAAGAALLFLFRGPLLSWFGGGGAVESAPKVLLLTACAAPFYASFQCSLNALFGLQRFAAYNLMKTAEAALPLAAAALTLASGRGLAAVAASYAAVQVALAAAGLWLLAPALAVDGRLPPKAERRDFLHFAGKSFPLQLFWLVMYAGDRLLVGGLLSLSDLGFYAVSASIARKFNVFCSVVADSVMPMMAELKGRGEGERLRNLYLKATELSLFVVFPVLILSFVLVPQFLTLWLGGDFGLRGTWPFRLLLLANFAYLATALPHYAAVASGAPEMSSAMQGTKTLLLIMLWPLFIPRWGIAGAALGLLAAEWLVTPFFLSFVHRRLLALSWTDYFSQAWARPALAALALAAYAFAARPYVGSWASLVASGSVGLLFFYGLGWRLLDKEAQVLLGEWAAAKWKKLKV